MRDVLLLFLIPALLFPWDGYGSGKSNALRIEALTLHRDAAGMNKGDLLNGFLDYRDQLDFNERMHILRTLEKKYPDPDPDVRAVLNYEIAAAHFLDGQYGSAINIFEQISDKNKDLKAKAIYSSARAYRALLNIPKARQKYRQIVDNYPRSNLYDDALFWLAHLEEDWCRSAERYKFLLDNVKNGDHRQGALERMISLQLQCGRVGEATINLNRHRAELSHGFEKEFARYYLKNRQYDKLFELIKRPENAWPGRFHIARLTIEQLIYDNRPNDRILDAYRNTISANYRDVRNFSAYLKRGDPYRGSQAFTFMDARKRLCFPDSLRNISEVLDFPNLYGDPTELIYSYNEALNLPGTPAEKGTIINRIAHLLLREQLYHSYRLFRDSHPVSDPMQAKRRQELHAKYLSIFDPNAAIDDLLALARNQQDEYIAKALLQLTNSLKPHIPAMKAHLNEIIRIFPPSDTRQAAALKLMQLQFYLDNDLPAVLDTYNTVHPSRDLPAFPEMTALRLAALAQLAQYDRAVNDACFYSLIDSRKADRCFRLLIENALSMKRSDIADSLRHFQY